MEHGHEPQRNGMILLTVVVSAVVLALFFVAGEAYFDRVRVEVDHRIRLSVPNPALDELRMRETIALEGYTWVDREQGRVHIPIDRAMELVLQDYRKSAGGR